MFNFFTSQNFNALFGLMKYNGMEQIRIEWSELEWSGIE
jgi:hypothetical protein